jgi:hypothetical protein
MVLRLIFILSSAGGASFSLSHLMMLVAGEYIIGIFFNSSLVSVVSMP